MKKRIKSFGYAGRGIRMVFISEPNMKIHIVVAILVIICGFLFSISLTEWMMCLLCIGMVFGAEMINTAIENVVDLASPDIHPLAKKANFKTKHLWSGTLFSHVLKLKKTHFVTWALRAPSTRGGGVWKRL